VDGALLERWERLIGLREEVNKALELARNDGLIRGGLEADVVVQPPDDETRDFLNSFGDGKHFLFITSRFAVGDAGDDAFRSSEIEGLAVAIRKATGSKCERCWHFTDDVGSDADWPEVCGRCSASVREILSDAGTT